MVRIAAKVEDTLQSLVGELSRGDLPITGDIAYMYTRARLFRVLVDEITARAPRRRKSRARISCLYYRLVAELQNVAACGSELADHLEKFLGRVNSADSVNRRRSTRLAAPKKRTAQKREMDGKKSSPRKVN